MSDKEENKSPTAASATNRDTSPFVTESMTDPLAIDFARIAAPISSDKPAGDYLRYEGTYDRIEEARKHDDISLPVGVWERKIKKADWNRVRTLCLAALTTRSKDLQIAMWLTEAQIHLFGFAGLAAGLEVIRTLCDNFWDDLHPLARDLDLDVRLSPFYWFNDKLALQLKFIPITQPEGVEAGSYTYADWEIANNNEGLAFKEKGDGRHGQNANKPSRAKFLGSVTFTAYPFFRDQFRHLGRCLESLTELESTLAACCGREAPSLRNFCGILDSIFTMVKKYMEQKEEKNEGQGTLGDASAREKQESAAYDPANSEVQFVSLSIRSRAQAYRMLDEAADYLLVHEPHSPAPYLVKRAVSWGHMSLTELLIELVNDNNDLKLIYNLLGIKSKAEG